MQEPSQVTIGKLALLASLPVSTVRYYLKEGLINGAKRTLSGYYLFDLESSLIKLQRIRSYQKNERLTIAEIRERFQQEREQ